MSDPYDRASFSGSLMGLAQGLLSQQPGEGVGAALGRGFSLAGSEAENARRAVTKKGDRKRDTEYRKKLAKELQDHGPAGDDTMSPDRVRFAQTYIASQYGSGSALGQEMVKALFARKTQTGLLGTEGEIATEAARVGQENVVTNQGQGQTYRLQEIATQRVADLLYGQGMSAADQQNWMGRNRELHANAIEMFSMGMDANRVMEMLQSANLGARETALEGQRQYGRLNEQAAGQVNTIATLGVQADIAEEAQGRGFEQAKEMQLNEFQFQENHQGRAAEIAFKAATHAADLGEIRAVKDFGRATSRDESNFLREQQLAQRRRLHELTVQESSQDSQVKIWGLENDSKVLAAEILSEKRATELGKLQEYRDSNIRLEAAFEQAATMEPRMREEALRESWREVGNDMSKDATTRQHAMRVANMTLEGLEQATYQKQQTLGNMRAAEEAGERGRQEWNRTMEIRDVLRRRHTDYRQGLKEGTPKFGADARAYEYMSKMGEREFFDTWKNVSAIYGMTNRFIHEAEIASGGQGGVIGPQAPDSY